MSCTESDTEAVERRRRWLSILAKAPEARLDTLWQALGPVPAYTILRRPETGLVMVHGRISGNGAPFCAGEMTVTRAAVRLDSRRGRLRLCRRPPCPSSRDRRRASTRWASARSGGSRLEAEIVSPLADEAEARHRLIAARAAATKVEFFTVAREAGT